MEMGGATERESHESNVPDLKALTKNMEGGEHTDTHTHTPIKKDLRNLNMSWHVGFSVGQADNIIHTHAAGIRLP